MTTNLSSQSPILANRYEILDEIGIGSTGIVNLGFDRLMQHPVALKRLLLPAELLELIDRPDRLRILFSLAKEFQTLASLKHPYVISVLDFGFDDNQQPYLVMEYIENSQSIIEYIQNKPERKKIRLLIQVLQALDYLHRRDVIHRDIKPENILIVDDQVKLIDFGLAAFPEQEQEIEGTLTHIAPEILQGEPFSPASDLYAVGVLAYQFFTGELPFYDSDAAEMQRQILEDDPQLEKMNCSQAFFPVVEQLLKKNPDKRYQRAQAVIQDIEQVSGITAAETLMVRESHLQAASFIGRESELDRLLKKLVLTRKRQGAAWLIAGEAGIGKSRLLEELRIRALVEGIHVIRSSEQGDGNLPYQLWRDVIRRLLLSVQVTDFEAGIIKEIVPDIERLLGRSIQDPPSLPDEVAQERLSLTVSHLLRRHEEPLLILIEDLHRVQESFLPLKRFINMIDETSVMIVASYRPEEAPGIIDSMSNIQTIHLDPLSREEIQELSYSMLGRQSSRLTDLLMRETEGNPFFLVEVMRMLAEKAGGLEQILQIGVLPDQILTGGIEQIIQRRLSYIDQSARELLKHAAVIGRQIDFTLLTQYLTDIHDLENWLYQCANAGILTMRDEEWYFSHQQIQVDILHHMEEQELAHYHRLVAETIQRVYPDDSDYVPILANHWYRAGEQQQALEFTLQAGHQVLNRNNIEEALVYATRGRELLTRNTAGVWFIRLRILFGTIYERLSDYKKAFRNYRKALRHPEIEAYPQERMQAYEGVGKIALRRADYDALTTASKKIIDLAKQLNHTSALIDALISLGVAAYEQQDYSEAHKYLQKSLQLSNETDHIRLAASSKTHLAFVCQIQEDYYKAVDYYKEALAVYEETGDSRSKAMLHRHYGILLEDMGNVSRALTQYENGLETAKNLYDLWLTAQLLCDLAFLSVKFSWQEKARSYLFEALAIAVHIDSKRLKHMLLIVFVYFFESTGDNKRAVELLGLMYESGSLDERLYRQRVQPAHQRLQQSMPESEFVEALEQGRSQNLHETAGQLIFEIS
jgi:serine/threonine protein kinase/Tfp pilus assembly protein PilF